MSAVEPFDESFRLSLANDLAKQILVVCPAVHLDRFADLHLIVAPGINDVPRRLRLERAIGRLTVVILKQRVDAAHHL